MGLRTQQLKGLTGGLNATACPRDLETQDGPTQSPDLLNCFALPGTVFSRLGSAPWWDTGGTGPLYWFSFFEPLKLGTGGSGTTIDGSGWHWPTAPSYPGPVPRTSSYTFRILTPANDTLNVDPEATLSITWEKRRGALGYKVQIKNFDTGIEVFSYEKPNRVPSYDLSPSLGVLERSKKYIIKVWAILAKSPEGAATQLEQTSNTRTFTTKLTVPTGLAPVGSISTLTPTLTCDAVTKALRYRVKIYDSTGTTVLHTSSALLLPSYPVGAGVLSSGTTYKWTFTAYPDTTATADYGVESEKASISTGYQVSLTFTGGGPLALYGSDPIILSSPLVAPVSYEEGYRNPAYPLISIFVSGGWNGCLIFWQDRAIERWLGNFTNDDVLGNYTQLPNVGDDAAIVTEYP